MLCLQAIRVSVSSQDAVSAHPLLVTVRQPRDITSWTLPYVESGYVRTLTDPLSAKILQITLTIIIILVRRGNPVLNNASCVELCRNRLKNMP